MTLLQCQAGVTVALKFSNFQINAFTPSRFYYQNSFYWLRAIEC
jgi:hypothetical protein